MSVNQQTPTVRGRPSASRTKRGGPRPSAPLSSELLVEQARAVAAALPALMRHLFTFEDDAVEELPLAQLKVCALLYSQPRPMSALSRELGVSLSAMTQVADRLERAQLVNRVPDGTDRRLRCLQLTERGAQLMRERERAQLHSVLAILKGLPVETRGAIRHALETLLDACQTTKGRLPSGAPRHGPGEETRS